jgi:hypothetical protein
MARAADRPAALSGLALVVACAVLLAFGIFVGVLVSEVDTDETRWTRLAWIFASVEAIAFGAAGALFGSSIQRTRAERAEGEAAEHRQAAANGRALAEIVKADAPEDGTPADEGRLESLGPGDRRAAGDVARRHADVARRLFP